MSALVRPRRFRISARRCARLTLMIIAGGGLGASHPRDRRTRAISGRGFLATATSRSGRCHRKRVAGHRPLRPGRVRNCPRGHRSHARSVWVRLRPRPSTPLSRQVRRYSSRSYYGEHRLWRALGPYWTECAGTATVRTRGRRWPRQCSPPPGCRWWAVASAKSKKIRMVRGRPGRARSHRRRLGHHPRGLSTCLTRSVTSSVV